MKFDKIPKKRFVYWGHIRDEKKFLNFQKKFDVIGVYWLGENPSISASYFLSLLQNGGSTRPPYNNLSTYEIYEEHSREMNKSEYNTHLFDHSAMWRTKDNKVFLTAMPYSDKELVNDVFHDFVNEFSFPETIRLQFLPDEYRFRPNGDFMIAIYDENVMTMEVINGNIL